MTEQTPASMPGPHAPEPGNSVPFTDAELAEAKRRCKAARWPEHHSPTCEWCAYCASTAPCARCNGTGAISGPDYFGNYDDTDKCPACDGIGRACCVSGVCDRHNALNDTHQTEDIA